MKRTTTPLQIAGTLVAWLLLTKYFVARLEGVVDALVRRVALTPWQSIELQQAQRVGALQHLQAAVRSGCRVDCNSTGDHIGRRHRRALIWVALAPAAE